MKDHSHLQKNCSSMLNLRGFLSSKSVFFEKNLYNTFIFIIFAEKREYYLCLNILLNLRHGRY